MTPPRYRERALLDPVALKKTNARLGYAIRKLNRRLAQLSRERCDEVRRQAERSPNEGDSHVRRFDQSRT